MTMAPATLWSVAFFRELIARGVEHVVVSPGARSQALALAAVVWEKVSGSPLTVHVVIDERSAAFVALGLGKETRRPAVCISTSGSAPSHYFPAVLEALHSGVPLIVVSADRPLELHGVGANQTTVQDSLLGERVPHFSLPAPDSEDVTGATEVASQAVGAAMQPGPVHVNIAFREPLSSPITLQASDLPVVTPSLVHEHHDFSSISLDPEPGTVVVAGSGAGPRAEALAVALGAPLIAEVVSGARFGPHCVPAYRELLNGPLRESITRVITVGRPTLSREVSALLQRTDVAHFALTGDYLEVANPSRSATIVDAVAVTREATSQERTDWVKPWIQAGRKVLDELLSEVTPEPADRDALDSDDQAKRSAFAKKEMEVLRQPVTRPMLALGVWEATWPHDRLVLGASRMIRELDRIAPGKNIPVLSNRGLSGIDGTIATARGIASGALGSGAPGVTRVLLGDLSFLHDVGSLLLEPAGLDNSRVHLFVANDGGGSIFDLLDTKAEREAHDRVLFTPHDVDVEALAKAYGWQYCRVANRGDLAEALGRSDQHLIVDVQLARA